MSGPNTPEAGLLTLPAERLDGDPEPESGERFEVIQAIGQGGSAVVYRVWDRLIDRQIASKELTEEQALDPRGVQRFISEARITGRLDHPHIVPVYDIGEDADGRCWFRMKLVRGRNLSKVIREQGSGRLTPEALATHVRTLAVVCDALAFAHHKGVLHLDVKPSNIMVSDFGEVYLMDWGVARQASAVRSTGTMVGGTPAFMPPEQAAGGALDPRADVFAIGACLYFVLTGRAPYQGDAHTALARASLGMLDPVDEQVTGLPPGLVAICQRAMSKEPDRRYPDTTSLRDALYAFLEGEWYLAEVIVPPGERIVTEGAPGDCAYIITKGQCRVVAGRGEDRQVLRLLEAGDVFGETAVFTGMPRTATVEAIDQVTLRLVTQETLEVELGRNRWLGAFVQALAERFRESDEKLRSLR